MAKMWLNISANLVLLLLGAALGSVAFLNEKPDFFVPCSLESDDFEQCYKDNLQALIVNLKTGIPGMPVSTKLEPIKFKRLKITQQDLKIELKNALVQGLSATNLTKVVLQPKDLSFLISASVPKLHVTGNYKILGTVFLLPLNSSGKIDVTTDNMSFDFLLKMQLKDADNFTFAEIQSLKSKIKNIKDFHIQLDNIFPDNAQLDEELNSLLNANWRQLINLMRPTLQNTLDAIVLSRLRKIFRYIPLNYFISDVPTAKQLYNSTLGIEQKSETE